VVDREQKARKIAEKLGMSALFEEKLKIVPDGPIYALRLAASDKLKAETKP
jgi:hypothetical protein